MEIMITSARILLKSVPLSVALFFTLSTSSLASVYFFSLIISKIRCPFAFTYSLVFYLTHAFFLFFSLRHINVKLQNFKNHWRKKVRKYFVFQKRGNISLFFTAVTPSQRSTLIFISHSLYSSQRKID